MTKKKKVLEEILTEEEKNVLDQVLKLDDPIFLSKLSNYSRQRSFSLSMQVWVKEDPVGQLCLKIMGRVPDADCLIIRQWIRDDKTKEFLPIRENDPEVETSYSNDKPANRYINDDRITLEMWDTLQKVFDDMMEEEVIKSITVRFSNEDDCEIVRYVFYVEEGFSPYYETDAD